MTKVVISHCGLELLRAAVFVTHVDGVFSLEGSRWRLFVMPTRPAEAVVVIFYAHGRCVVCGFILVCCRLWWFSG